MEDRFDEGAVSFPGPDGALVTLPLAVPPDASDALAGAIRAGRHTLGPPARLVLDLARGRRLLDLGAHLGTVALPAAALGATVTAVEPSPRNVRALAASVQRTGLPVEVVHAAVADAPGTVHLVEDGPFTRVREQPDGATVAVEALPLPALAARAGGRPDVIKVDVEGHELEALAGLPALLADGPPPHVVLESNGHVLRLRGRSPRLLADRLRELGYAVYLIEDSRLVPLPAGALQPETVVDLLATVADPPAWPVAEPLDPAASVRALADELRHPNHWHRAWAASELEAAPDQLLSGRRVRAALDAALRDEEDEVRAAAAWWRARRPARGGLLGLRGRRGGG